MSKARREPQNLERYAGALNLEADRSGLVNARDRRLIRLGQMAYEVQHHLFGAADRKGVRQVKDSGR